MIRWITLIWEFQLNRNVLLITLLNEDEEQNVSRKDRVPNPGHKTNSGFTQHWSANELVDLFFRCYCKIFDKLWTNLSIDTILVKILAVSSTSNVWLQWHTGMNSALSSWSTWHVESTKLVGSHFQCVVLHHIASMFTQTKEHQLNIYNHYRV